jgi:2-keto-3-deoxy-L-rhamnonate aldolase RhmA
MKSTALQQFRRKLRGDEPAYGLWVTLEAAAVSEIAAGLGFDWIVIDAARGHLDWAEVYDHIRATARSQTVALVRLPGASPDLVKRALTLGADGVLVSEVETLGELRSIVERSKAWVYASGQPSANATRESDEGVLIVPVINLEQDGPKLREISSLEGIDCLLFLDDSNVLSSTEGRAKQDEMLAEIRTHGKHAGVIAEDNEALRVNQERGFMVLGVGPDAAIIRSGVHSTLEAVGRATKP